MSLRSRISLITLCWLSAAFRFHGLFANRFHSDEALFASYARLIAIWRDPLLQHQAIDKPPLLFYLQALFYPLQGPVEWAARLPGFIASLLLIPLVAVLAWRLFGDELAALLAAALVAFSPLAIQFSATAFTDPLLTTLLIVSFCLAASSENRLVVTALAGPSAADAGTTSFFQRYWNASAHGNSLRTSVLSGLWFGLAALTKYQAWLFIPLFLGFGTWRGWRKRQWMGWLTGLLPVLATLLLWDLARSGRPALWPSQVANFGGIRLAWSWELWPRLMSWLSIWRLTLSPLFLMVGLLFLPAAGFRPGDDRRPVILLLALFLVGYFWLHWALAVPVWDRYVLPAVPWLAILLAPGLAWLLRAADQLSRQISWAQRLSAPRIVVAKGWTGLLIGLFFIGQLPAAAAARAGQFPVGGRPSADQGAATIAAYLADAPYGTVLYDHWLSWQWRYQLLDKRVYVSWFPHPQALVEDLAAFGLEGERYLALPASAAARPVIRAVQSAGFTLEQVAVGENTDTRLYRLAPPRTPK